MNLKQFKRKKNFAPNNDKLLPNDNEEIIKGCFNGVNVIVTDNSHMASLYNMGFFGKGSISKSFPRCAFQSDDLPEIITEQQLLNRKRWGNKISTGSSNALDDRKLALANESVVCFLKKTKTGCSQSWKQYKAEMKNDCFNLSQSMLSPQQNDLDYSPADFQLIDFVEEILKSGEPRKSLSSSQYPENVVVIGGDGGPRLEEDIHVPQEVLHLSLQEAFFLSTIGRLRVNNLEGKVLGTVCLWKLFRNLEEEFLRRYIAYHWYRSRGWIVRSGLKYGGDYLLYEKGPSLCHSSYVVHVFSESSNSWSQLIMLQRLAETTNKDLLYCHILPACDLSDADLDNPDVISKFTVQEVMYRRWIPSEQRLAKPQQNKKSCTKTSENK